MDMSPAYVKGATQYFPQAWIVFDKFHVMVLAGRALDLVRRELQREGADLKGAMWSLRGNTWNLSEERQEQRKKLCRQYTKLGRAMSLRDGRQLRRNREQLADKLLKRYRGRPAVTATAAFAAISHEAEHREGSK